MRTLEQLQNTFNSTEQRFHSGLTQGEFARRGVHVLTDGEYVVGPQGELRWVSSNNVVPTDILEMAVVDGVIGYNAYLASEQVREVENEIILRDYINFRQTHGYSEEELMEIDAEWGDEEPVDFFTGREIRTGKFVL
jgi:hypothetical protein